MKYWITLMLLTAAGAASAHPGHAEAGFAAGLMHPLAGMDHWLAMLGLGLWSRMARVPLKALLTVVAALAIGAFVLPALPTIPGLEPLLAASVLVAGLMGLGAAKVPAWLGLALAAAFSLVHGQAHGQELAGASAALGAICASMALIALGSQACISLRIGRAAAAMVVVAGSGMIALA